MKHYTTTNANINSASYRQAQTRLDRTQRRAVLTRIAERQTAAWGKVDPSVEAQLKALEGAGE